MRNRPEQWTLDALREARLGHAVMWATPSVFPHTQSLSFEKIPDLRSIRGPIDSLIAIGGGTLLDEAKYWRFTVAPKSRLIVIPSIWGSGAEVSPIAVLEREGRKVIHNNDALLPDIRVTWPDLAESIPAPRARDACGDAWSHALEGFLSPLATDSLRQSLADIIRTMTDLPLTNDARWFEPSAQACACQAQASVGLVHGIAHTLEIPLREAQPENHWGHANLCATFLWPVMAYNRSRSDKWDHLAARHGLDTDAIFSRLKTLHDPERYSRAVTLLDTHWKTIQRDVCTRTNSALVRGSTKSWFVDREFQ